MPIGIVRKLGFHFAELRGHCRSCARAIAALLFSRACTRKNNCPKAVCARIEGSNSCSTMHSPIAYTPHDRGLRQLCVTPVIPSEREALRAAGFRITGL